MLIKTEIWPSLYQDSVILMRIASKIRAREGIDEAAAFMGTPSNLEILEAAGMASDEGRKAGPNDIILTVKADSEEAAAAAFEAARAMLTETAATEDEEADVRPATLDSALRRMPNANLAAISVPGQYAAAEARRALHRNLNVFLFSDNVPLEAEIELKKKALESGLLCMGPDCGTAYLCGKGLGFFNVVKRGRVGCVAAAGTGLQAVVSRLAALGEGISHGIGVGGRDLSAEVGGMMTLTALKALSDDPSTEAVVLISKPPHPDVMAKLQEVLDGISKPVVICALGSSARVGGKVMWVETLEDAAEATAAFLQGRKWTPQSFSDPIAVRARLNEINGRLNGREHNLLGLYTGGTLAHEANLILRGLLGDVALNGKPFKTDKRHQIIDLGGDEYTVGRPHPMIAPETRTEIVIEAGRADIDVLLLDLVLGKGAHEDPARPLAESLKRAGKLAGDNGRSLIAVGSVVGTDGDPQALDRQIETLVDAGVVVFPSNAQAVRFAALAVRPELADSFLGEAK